jgi:hypothetical protein
VSKLKKQKAHHLEKLGINRFELVFSSSECSGGGTVQNCKDTCDKHVNGERFCLADPCNTCSVSFRNIARYTKEEIGKYEPNYYYFIHRVKQITVHKVVQSTGIKYQ